MLDQDYGASQIKVLEGLEDLEQARCSDDQAQLTPHPRAWPSSILPPAAACGYQARPVRHCFPNGSRVGRCFAVAAIAEMRIPFRWRRV